MRYALAGAIGLMALLFAASAVAVDLSRVLPSFELPAAPRLRAESPSPQSPAGVTDPNVATAQTDTVVGTEPSASLPGEPTTSPATSPSVPAGAASQAAPTRRERGWREMLPGLLHQP